MQEQFSFNAKDEAWRTSHFKNRLNEFYKHKPDSLETKELMNTVFEMFREYTAARVALDEIDMFLNCADIERGKNEELDGALEVVSNAAGRGPDSARIQDWNRDLCLLYEVLDMVSIFERQKGHRMDL